MFELGPVIDLTRAYVVPTHGVQSVGPRRVLQIVRSERLARLDPDASLHTIAGVPHIHMPPAVTKAVDDKSTDSP